MAYIRSQNRRRELFEWAANRKRIAQHCFERLEKLRTAVFSSPEHFSSYLNLMARISYYDAYNLLLIWEKCPDASFLAGSKFWKRKLPDGAKILKATHEKNDIDLVAPFTDNGKTCLTWFSVSVYDISQTNVGIPRNNHESIYIHDDFHEDFLIDSLKEALSIKFEKSVIFETPSQAVLDADLPGEFRGDTVITREDLSPQELIQWLTTALVQLELADSGLQGPASQLARTSICYCLLRIWKLEQYAKAPSSSFQLRAVEQGSQQSFLHLLRDTIWELNVLVARCYLARRQDNEEPGDPDLSDFLSSFNMSEYTFEIELRKQLSFCEAQILVENLSDPSTQVALIERLSKLQENTSDDRLRKDLKSLLSKVKVLTSPEFEKLKKEAESGLVFLSSDYNL